MASGKTLWLRNIGRTVGPYHPNGWRDPDDDRMTRRERKSLQLAERRQAKQRARENGHGRRGA